MEEVITVVMCKTFKLSWDTENTYVLVYQHCNGEDNIHMSLALLDSPELYMCFTIKHKFITFIGETDIDIKHIKDARYNATSEKINEEVNKILHNARRVRRKNRIKAKSMGY